MFYELVHLSYINAFALANALVCYFCVQRGIRVLNVGPEISLSAIIENKNILKKQTISYKFMSP
jgi:hypothetical protein